MNQKPSRPSSVTQTTLAIPLVIVVWAVVATLSYLAIGLLDSVRGLGDDWLQKIFRDLFTPGLGGYVAIQASNSWLPRANQKIVFACFCLLTVIFMISLPLSLIVTSYESTVFTLRDQIFLVLGGAAALFGAWLVHKRRFCT